MTNESKTIGLDQLSAEAIASIKQQIIDDMKDDVVKRREQEDAVREKYIALMKESPDPWIEVYGGPGDDKGIKIEMVWNDSFISLARKDGITGKNDDAVVHKWFLLFAKDIIDQMDDGEDKASEYV